MVSVMMLPDGQRPEMTGEITAILRGDAIHRVRADAHSHFLFPPATDSLYDGRP